jgi:hypothetical protein
MPPTPVEVIVPRVLEAESVPAPERITWLRDEPDDEWNYRGLYATRGAIAGPAAVAAYERAKRARTRARTSKTTNAWSAITIDCEREPAPSGDALAEATRELADALAGDSMHAKPTTPQPTPRARATSRDPATDSTGRQLCAACARPTARQRPDGVWMHGWCEPTATWPWNTQPSQRRPRR